MKLLLYCTKAKPYLLNQNIYEFYDSKYITSNLKHHKGYDYTLNGKIVAECDFEVEEIEYSLIVANNKPYHYYEPQNTFVDKFYEKSCLNHQQVEEYLGYKNGYAIHIKNLHIFDKPRELSEHWIKQAPQNMCYGWCQSFAIDERVIIISIQPQWLCKILNGEKTIEVRKKVLKEMLKNEK